MNEIQTIKAEKLAEVKKNSKKGFTLIELVVVIAILAVLAVIAIPVVSGTITSSQKSSATNNASTLELAIKEADAMWKANDTSVYTTSPTIADVVKAKSLTQIPNDVKVENVTYKLGWNKTDNKVYYYNTTGGTTTSVDGKTLNSPNFTDFTISSTTAVSTLMTTTPAAPVTP